MPNTKTIVFFSSVNSRTFFKSLLIANQTSLNQIYNHPFNQQLLDGTLPKLIFGDYLRKDYFYLIRFGMTLQKLAVRAKPENPHLARQLTHLGHDIIGGEQQMQCQYKEYLLSSAPNHPGPTIKNYTQYIEEITAQAPISVALASVLPCFWVYYEIGTRQKPTQLANNPYKNWINTYSSPKFVQATYLLARTVSSLGNEASPIIKEDIGKAFKKSVHFEHQFFEEVLPTATHVIDRPVLA